MMTIPISYSSPIFDSAYYPPLLCTGRLGPGICPCTFTSSSYNHYSSSYSNSSASCSPTYTPASSPTFGPTPAPVAHQSANLVSAMLSGSPASLSFSKFLFNPNASYFNQPFSQQYPTALFNSPTSTMPTYCNGTAKRFVFTPGSWKQS